MMKITLYYLACILLLLLNTNSVAKETIQEQSKEKLTEVIFLPTIHSNHLKSTSYSLSRLEEVLREIKPDTICTEIVPSSLAKHNKGEKDKRLSLFPEYMKVILPLQDELKYKVIPCSAYSPKVNFRTVGVAKMTKAHSEKISAHLDTCKGEGKKVLITFGGGHISGLVKHLSTRTDINITDYRPILNKQIKKTSLKN